MVRVSAFACLVVVLVACGSSSGSTASASPSTSPSPSPSATPQLTLSATDRAEIAQLEKKPLKIPPPASDGGCHQGPFTAQITPYANGNPESEVYGLGPIYGAGSSPTHIDSHAYFDVTYFTDPTVHSVALVRINDLSRKYVGRFVGPLAVGPSLGTESIRGTQMEVRSELALPAENPPVNAPAAAPGWGVFHVTQGIDSRFTCAAIQIDTASLTEVILGD